MQTKAFAAAPVLYLSEDLRRKNRVEEPDFCRVCSCGLICEKKHNFGKFFLLNILIFRARYIKIMVSDY